MTWNNYNALIIKTDCSEDFLGRQTGHEWVVVAVQSVNYEDGKSELIKMYEFLDNYENLHPLNCQFVNLCNDYKAKVGALICDDEYNTLRGKLTNE